MKEKSDPLSGLTPERWQQIDQILEEALELEPARQRSFLDTACGGDPELRAELVSLLAAHQRSAGVLDRSALDPVAGTLVEKKLQSLVGTQLCSYRILALVGAGGMGAVYRTLDTRLDRTVALKILPEDLVPNTDRMRRFTTEAKAASSLNHPNICTVHELGECRGIRFITMEYVEGQRLKEITAERSLNPGEIADIGIQVADALEAAHGRGIIHRDIKPGNLMVTARGLVKVLDFGIAKVKRPQDADSVTTLTQDGMIMGTIDYMSPEQVLGRDVDGRTDIFSLGAVLYELAAGRPPFSGDTTTETMDRILHADPDFSEGLKSVFPSEFQGIVRRCLEKNARRRYQSAGELLAELKDFRQSISSGRPILRLPGRTVFTAVVLTALLALIAIAGLTRTWLQTPGIDTPLTVVPLTSYPGFEAHPSFSPDGSQVAFASGDHIYIKQIHEEALFQLTAGKEVGRDPTWSPDGRWIAFLRARTPLDWAGGDYSVILKPPLGGMEHTLTQVHVPTGIALWKKNIAWHPDGDWLVVPDGGTGEEASALFAISLHSRERRRLTSPPGGFIGDGGPSFSPSGRTLAFARHVSSHVSNVWLLNVSDGMVPAGTPRQITSDENSFAPAWTPGGSELVYTAGPPHAPSLWRLDLERLQDPPKPLPISGPAFGPVCSRQGHLAFMQRRPDINIWKIDASLADGGTRLPNLLISSTYVDHLPRLSPDGRRIAFASYRSGTPEIWVSDRNGTNLSRLTSFRGPETDIPAWSPNSREIAFTSRGVNSSDIYVVNVEERRLRRLPTERSVCWAPSYSPDGQWIYYGSTHTGRSEIWKSPSEGVDEAIQVTRSGGSLPAVSPDGEYVYFVKEKREVGGSLWRMPVGGGNEREILPNVYGNCYAVTRRGIYFIAPADMPPSIEFLSFETDKVTTFAKLPHFVGWGLDVSADEEEILYTGSDSKGSDLMLIENFR